jgi:ferredoxin--NADP+ reductase
MGGFIHGEIVERIDITPHLATFRVAPEQPIAFLPGQFVRLGLTGPGGRITQRSYSICSAPHEPLLEFFVELVPEGVLTPRIWDLGTGDSLLVHDTAAGVFTLQHEERIGRHMMICTVAGVAPYLSMLRAHAHALASGATDDLRFLLIQEADLGADLALYGEELAEIARGGWLTYVPTVSKPADDPAWHGETGRVEDVLRKHADALGFDHTSAIAYLCGHPEMIDNARMILERARFPKQQIRTEKYFSLKKQTETGRVRQVE